MYFTFTRTIMKLKKIIPIKFEPNWSNESKEIWNQIKPGMIQVGLEMGQKHQLSEV